MDGHSGALVPYVSHDTDRPLVCTHTTRTQIFVAEALWPPGHEQHLGTKTEQLLRNYGERVLQAQRAEGGRPPDVPRPRDDEDEEAREARLAAEAADRAATEALVGRLGSRGDLPIPRESVTIAPLQMSDAQRGAAMADWLMNVMCPRVDSYLDHMGPPKPPGQIRRPGRCKRCGEPRKGHKKGARQCRVLVDGIDDDEAGGVEREEDSEDEQDEGDEDGEGEE